MSVVLPQRGRARGVIATTAAMLALAACGGGTSGPSKTDYIARADRVCQATKVQVAPLVADLSQAAAGSLTAERARGLALLVDRLHRAGTSYMAQLERLKQPSGDRADIQGFLGSSKEVVDSLGRAVTLLRAGNVTGALALLQSGTAQAQSANSAAQAYGFKQCLSVLPTTP